MEHTIYDPESQKFLDLNGVEVKRNGDPLLYSLGFYDRNDVK